MYRKTSHRNIELTEVGPRFELKCEFGALSHIWWWGDTGSVGDNVSHPFLPPVYMIRQGTLEQEATADVEWRWHPYTNTAHKRVFLSAE